MTRRYCFFLMCAVPFLLLSPLVVASSSSSSSSSSSNVRSSDCDGSRDKASGCRFLEDEVLLSRDTGPSDLRSLDNVESVDNENSSEQLHLQFTVVVDEHPTDELSSTSSPYSEYTGSGGGGGVQGPPSDSERIEESEDQENAKPAPVLLRSSQPYDEKEATLWLQGPDGGHKLLHHLYSSEGPRLHANGPLLDIVEELTAARNNMLEEGRGKSNMVGRDEVKGSIHTVGSEEKLRGSEGQLGTDSSQTSAALQPDADHKKGSMYDLLLSLASPLDTVRYASLSRGELEGMSNVGPAGAGLAGRAGPLLGRISTTGFEGALGPLLRAGFGPKGFFASIGNIALGLEEAGVVAPLAQGAAAVV